MKICLGVSAGIAAYKSAELIRLLQQEGFQVQVVMTARAGEFITPLTLASLSGQKVITSMFEGPGGEANIESAIEHIAVAQAIDLLLIAPATADLIAKLAGGIADDFLTTLYLATRAPVILAPAMNVNMWEHAATQENLDRLRRRGVRVVEPDEGYLACGMTGPGRLASLESIVAAVVGRAASVSERVPGDLRAETVLVSAGPTQEALDPVRFISNRSSGKMGYAVARAAAGRGARTVLVSGPSALAPPAGVELVNVRTAEEMHAAMTARMEEATIIVMAAAVADYRPAAPSPGKIKKSAERLTIDLVRTPDILSALAGRKGPRILVGFAAETEDVVAEARKKLSGKNLDLVVANDVSRDVFDSDSNAAILVTPDGERPLPRMSKLELAGHILDAAIDLKSRMKQSILTPP